MNKPHCLRLFALILVTLCILPSVLAASFSSSITEPGKQNKKNTSAVVRLMPPEKKAAIDILLSTKHWLINQLESNGDCSKEDADLLRESEMAFKVSRTRYDDLIAPPGILGKLLNQHHYGYKLLLKTVKTFLPNANAGDLAFKVDLLLKHIHTVCLNSSFQAVLSYGRIALSTPEEFEALSLATVHNDFSDTLVDLQKTLLESKPELYMRLPRVLPGKNASGVYTLFGAMEMANPTFKELVSSEDKETASSERSEEDPASSDSSSHTPSHEEAVSSPPRQQDRWIVNPLVDLEPVSSSTRSLLSYWISIFLQRMVTDVYAWNQPLSEEDSSPSGLENVKSGTIALYMSGVMEIFTSAQLRYRLERDRYDAHRIVSILQELAATLGAVGHYKTNPIQQSIRGTLLYLVKSVEPVKIGLMLKALFESPLYCVTLMQQFAIGMAIENFCRDPVLTAEVCSDLECSDGLPGLYNEAVESLIKLFRSNEHLQMRLFINL